MGYSETLRDCKAKFTSREDTRLSEAEKETGGEKTVVALDCDPLAVIYDNYHEASLTKSLTQHHDPKGENAPGHCETSELTVAAVMPDELTYAIHGV